MASLKSFLPQLGKWLQVSPAALYERQRVLVRLGVLTERKGRGPGSGVKLTADALAALLASLLITDNLSEVDERVGRLLKTPNDDPHEMPWAEATFGEMLARVLVPQSEEFRSWSFSVDRRTLCASVFCLGPGIHEHAYYGPVPEHQSEGIQTESTLNILVPSPLISAIQSAVSK